MSQRLPIVSRFPRTSAISFSLKARSVTHHIAIVFAEGASVSLSLASLTDQFCGQGLSTWTWFGVPVACGTVLTPDREA
jgi:hypothetical protein